MAEQSKFSKLPKRHLFIISETLIDNNFESRGYPTDQEYEENYNILKNISRHFNMEVNDEDVQFFIKFLQINDDLLSQIFETNDKSLINNLEIPVAETYELKYSVVGSCSYEEFLSQKVDAYDEEWVISSVERQRDDGDWDIYEGRTVRDTEYDNFDIHDFSFDDVIKVPNNNVDKLKESIVKKLLVENTSDFISKLDKQTLLKLKQIIESRLRSL
jgi:hypothetical protein